MTKTCKSLMVVLAFFLSFVPFLGLKAETVTVKTQEELKNALANKDVTEIVLGEDIHTTEKINITRPVTIDGANYTIMYTGKFGKDNSDSNTVWGGIYVLQVYKTTATIKNIKLTGANAALLVNGGNVKLVGKIDVSGNGFGGIELGQGKGVSEISHLSLGENTDIINTTESENAPTLWVPDDSASAVVEINGLEQIINPGEELAKEELEAKFVVPNVPATNDNIVVFMVLGMVAVVSSVVSFKKVLSN